MSKQDRQRLSTKVWKFGCNWAGCERSFYEFIKDNEVVIGYDKFKYDIGDLVVISEGHTVKAIAKVLGERVPITSKPEYKFLEKDYRIDYKDWTYLSNAEWYELPKNEIFKYKVQRGGARI